MINEWGLNGDETLTLDEYKELVNKSIEDAIFEDVVSVLIRDADKDNTGYLTASQLKDVLVKMKPKDKSSVGKTVEMFMNMADSAGDKKLKVEEALKLLTTGKEELKDPKERMRTLFRMCDTNDDGYISNKEMTEFIKMINTYKEEDEDEDITEEEKEEALQIMTMFTFMSDLDGDGKLNYLEFCTAMTAC